jgi:hypothetical protein
MRRILHHHGARRWLRLHIGLIADPPRGVIVESGAGGDDGPQVDPDRRRAAVGVELAEGVERGSRGECQPQLAAHPRSQRMVREGRGRDAVDNGALFPTAQDDGVDRHLRFGVGQGVEPEVLHVDGA